MIGRPGNLLIYQKDRRTVGFRVFLLFVDAPKPPRPRVSHVVYVEAALADGSVSPEAK